MEFCTLASGSSGNAALIRRGDDVVLIDAGISARRIAQSLGALGLTPQSVRAVFITHEHSDHVAGLAVFAKKSGAAVYASRGTAARLGILPDLRPFDAGDTLAVGALEIRSFRTSHDAADSVGYRVDDADGSLGVLTDTGFVTDEAADAVLGADALVLESNHDPDMLRSGPYPLYLQQRILGPRGHLSNENAAEFALACAARGTNDIVLAHLSAENNTPETAEYTILRALQSHGYVPRVCIAPRYEMSEVHLCRRSPSFASAN